MKGVVKGFLRYKMSRHFKNIGTCQFMRSNEGGESAFPPLGSGACRGAIIKRFDGDDSFVIPILYIEKGFRKVKKRVKNAQLLCSIRCSV